MGSISRLSMRSTVDFPDPDKPMITKNSPGATENVHVVGRGLRLLLRSDFLPPNQLGRDDDVAPPRGP